MRKRQILIILAVASGLLVCLPKVGNSETMGTAFTYQGRLIDTNEIADGPYDFQFRLFDSAGGAGQVGGDVDMPDIDVADGYFTAELDFGGGSFDGSRRWLEIGVRPGELEDPNVYTALSPRQEVTPNPYALYAKTAGSGGDNDWMVSGKDMYSIPSGDVGIGTTSPSSKFHIEDNTSGSLALTIHNLDNSGDERIRFGTGSGSDAGIIVWGSTHPSYQGRWRFYNNKTSGHYDWITGGSVKMTLTSAGSLGIGTDAPAEKLHVTGDIRLDAGGDIAFADDNTRIRESADDLYLEADDDIYISPDNDIWMDAVTLFVDGSADSVGIGTSSPDYKLEVNGEMGTSADASGKLRVGRYSAVSPNSYISAAGGADQMRLQIADSTKMVITSDNKVGIGTTSPAERLTVRGGNLLIENSGGTDIVELGEGLDYAEGFDVSDKSRIAPGSVLVIDSENPGKLAMSNKAYDKRVAGIVAGAKGMGSGVRLGSEQFDYDVALAGRVYCNVDATEAAVQPGDLLTTSATSGYAMKAADYTRAKGAILGKAMEKLEKGKKGQILVLVTLQ